MYRNPTAMSKRVQSSYAALMERAAVQEFTAAMAASAAHEAERTEQIDMANAMSATARRCRANAAKLRARAHAAAQSPGR